MWHRAFQTRLVLMVLLLVVSIRVSGTLSGKSQPAEEPNIVQTASDGTWVSIVSTSATDPALQIHVLGVTRPLLGQTEQTKDRLIFRPSLPLTSGKTYLATWRSASGKTERAEFQLPSKVRNRPTVLLSPACPLPANALRFYLTFSEPMEQGVFLDKLRLFDSKGSEILGPFRETELWSPDGKRLTVWLHPGRQKTGVNLQTDEGPVLSANSRHSLVISGDWRSTQGTPIGDEVRIPISSSNPDHTCPSVARWKFTLPRPQTLDPLIIDFDEPLDPAILTEALEVRYEGRPVRIVNMISAACTQFQGKPDQPWRPGTYELRASPILEDLAGNNVLHPFEVDIHTRSTETPLLKRTFILGSAREK